MVYPDQQYIFDTEKIKLPEHLQSALSRECHDALKKVFDAATVAFRHLKAMQKLRDERYRAMCSRENLTQYNLHAESVDRLFSWGQDPNPDNPPLAAEAKIPSFVLHFHVEQRAYDEYMKHYIMSLERYLAGPYKKWHDMKMWLEHVVSKSTMNPVDRRDFFHWWLSVLLPEMTKWEDALPGLLLPSWEEVVDDVYFAILERVEIGTSAVTEFYVSTAATAC